MPQIPRIAAPLLAWYQTCARCLPWRGHPDPYAVWVSEIMLQQTRVEAVKTYFERFLRQLPCISDLACADEQTLLKLWEGLGYYSRVRNLQKAARVVMAEYGGHLPASFEELKKLPGIGEYTAGAIASIAFQLPVPAVDGNVLRVMTRLTADERDITKPAVKKDYFSQIEALLGPLEKSGDFNQALMDLGATVCLPNGLPKCEGCPVAPFCEALAQNRVLDFPVKPGKKPRKTEQHTVFLLRQNDRVALQKRPRSGLLAGLWEFPHVPGFLSTQDAAAQLEHWGLQAEHIEPSVRYTHLFSHIEWQMESYLVTCAQNPPAPPPFVWVSKPQLLQTYPLPSAFQPFASGLLWNEKPV